MVSMTALLPSHHIVVAWNMAVQDVSRRYAALLRRHKDPVAGTLTARMPINCPVDFESFRRLAEDDFCLGSVLFVSTSREGCRLVSLPIPLTAMLCYALVTIYDLVFSWMNPYDCKMPEGHSARLCFYLFAAGCNNTRPGPGPCWRRLSRNDDILDTMRKISTRLLFSILE